MNEKFSLTGIQRLEKLEKYFLPSRTVEK